MTNKLQNIDNFGVDTISVKQGEINFKGFGDMKAQADEIAKAINSMEITEDNIKESKKILAGVNKALTALNQKRIEIKKAFNAPYDFFNNQVKMIETTIKEAEKNQRDKVKEFEEIERNKKESEILELWEKYSEASPSYKYVAELFSFDEFLTPSMLNKTMTLTKIKVEIAQWFSEKDKDLTTIKLLPDADEVLVEYRSGLNLADSISTVAKRKELLQQIEKEKHSVDTGEITSDTTPETYVLYFHDRTSFNFAKTILDNNHIEYSEV